MIDSEILAEYILDNSKQGLSILELQQFLYMIQLAYIQEFKEFLIKEPFQAWDYGPIEIKVYEKYRKYLSSSIDKPKRDYEYYRDSNDNIIVYNYYSDYLSIDEQDFINLYIKKLNKYSYWRLKSIIKQHGSAWNKVYEKEKKHIIQIPQIIEDSKFLLTEIDNDGYFVLEDESDLKYKILKYFNDNLKEIENVCNSNPEKSYKKIETWFDLEGTVQIKRILDSQFGANNLSNLIYYYLLTFYIDTEKSNLLEFKIKFNTDKSEYYISHSKSGLNLFYILKNSKLYGEDKLVELLFDQFKKNIFKKIT